jgi:hypothetical protein
MPTIADLLNAQDWMAAPRLPREASAPGFKGLGYFGAIDNGRGQYSTELASESDGLHYPLMVPTLTGQELRHLLSGAQPTDEIYRKAYNHAVQRGLGAKDPFATMFDQRTPVPE